MSTRTILSVLAPTAFLLIFFVVPLLYVAWLSFMDPTPGLANYVRFFKSGYMVETLLRTAMMSAVVTLLSLIMAYPVAFLMANGAGLYAKFLGFVVMSSFLVSFLVRTFAWLIILGKGGPAQSVLMFFGWDPAPRLLYTTFASIIAMTQMLTPLMALVLYATMKRIDPVLLRASTSLGANNLRGLVHIYFPLSLPGVANGVTLVFITCLGFYVTPAILGSPRNLMISGLIGKQIEEMLSFGTAAASSMILMAFTGALFLIYSSFSSLEKLWGPK
ncbi:MAG: ABC transporter permease [Confluentimicrobium sp.]|jgi:ABC-type spermidine/putrescine transport system permease subunit I|uniref:ABC transporter permease n=1 Tax=Actibacterium sp. TaxID=1872125 RepID=UPI000C463AEF|nr:ABC transporter permease [Actibacterium sp.]MBC57176.1 ABC transporter permease [Actibacterium sp.]|tara:strand:- start:24844 stop:25665 length:822 start_codon:yes stop_codon:yes gene_type:complete